MTLKFFCSYCMFTLAYLFSLQCTFMIMCHQLKSYLNFFLINFLPFFSILNHLPFIARVFQAFFHSLLSSTSSNSLPQGPFFFVHLFSIVFCISLLFIFLTFALGFCVKDVFCVWFYHAQIDLDVIIALKLLLLCMFCRLTLLPSHPKIIVILHILHIDLVAFTLYNCALLEYFHLLMDCPFVCCFLFFVLFSYFHCYFCCKASTHNSLFIWQLQTQLTFSLPFQVGLHLEVLHSFLKLHLHVVSYDWNWLK